MEPTTALFTKEQLLTVGGLTLAVKLTVDFIKIVYRGFRNKEIQEHWTLLLAYGVSILLILAGQLLNHIEATWKELILTLLNGFLLTSLAVGMNEVEKRARKRPPDDDPTA